MIETQTDLCIEYPLREKTLYLSPAHSSLKIKAAFECAYHLLSAVMSNCTQHCILDSIVHIPGDVFAYRNWIHNKFKYVSLLISYSILKFKIYLQM